MENISIMFNFLTKIAYFWENFFKVKLWPTFLSPTKNGLFISDRYKSKLSQLNLILNTFQKSRSKKIFDHNHIFNYETPWKISAQGFSYNLTGILVSYMRLGA